VHTDCSYCHTLFNVSAEQLKVVYGTVQWGHCMNIFDALEALDDGDVARNATDDEQQSLSGLEGVVPAHASIDDELATETLSITHKHADGSIDHGAAH